MGTSKLWPRILLVVGGSAMLFGALDPLEGSVLILPGSGLVALGALLSRSRRRWIAYRVVVFVLIAIGVAALWGLSVAGGTGGASGYSVWWNALILPYLVGWSMGIWGPGSPRWMLWLGILIGIWYQVILALAIWKNSTRSESEVLVWPSIVLAVIGLATIVGCVTRLVKPDIKQPGPS